MGNQSSHTTDSYDRLRQNIIWSRRKSRYKWLEHLVEEPCPHRPPLAKVKGKFLPYSLPSVGPGDDPGVQAVSLQMTFKVIPLEVGCHYFPSGLRSPFQPKNVTVILFGDWGTYVWTTCPSCYAAMPRWKRLWNSLPTDVTSATTLPVFCPRLKLYLFSVSFFAWSAFG